MRNAPGPNTPTFGKVPTCRGLGTATVCVRKIEVRPTASATNTDLSSTRFILTNRLPWSVEYRSTSFPFHRESRSSKDVTRVARSSR